MSDPENKKCSIKGRCTNVEVAVFGDPENNKINNVGAGLVSACGITLMTLVITIIILIILASVTINLTLGDNGLITNAKEAKKKQIMEDAKEKIGTEILVAQAEAIERNEELEQAQVEDIISKYGELQEDGDTIVLNDNKYEISLKEIYTGTTSTTGSYTENQAKIKLLESQVENLQKQLEDVTTTNILYSVSASIYRNTTTTGTSGYIVMPDTDTPRYITNGKCIAGFVSEKVTLSANNKITLSEGEYLFESYVPVRTAKYGVGYKVFDSDGKIIIDHTPTGTTDDFASTNFKLDKTTDLKIYWYTTGTGWSDLTYYKIKSI